MIPNSFKKFRSEDWFGYLFASLVFLAPLYVWRFQLSGLPVNFLMVFLPLLWLAAIIDISLRSAWSEFIKNLQTVPAYIRCSTALFFLAATVSLFALPISQNALGQYLVWIVEPIITAGFALWYWRNFSMSNHPLIIVAYLFVAASGFFALIQFFTFIGLPATWWGNAVEPKRAISFFQHPNGFSLFVGPLLALVLPDLSDRLLKRERSGILALLAWLFGLAGLIVSLSRGSWFGVAAAIALFVVVKGNWKVWLAGLGAAVITLVLIFNIPHLKYRLILPFYGEKSASARLSLWQTGWAMVKDKPILGQGLTGFSEKWVKFNHDSALDHYNFPHNIFLNFWISTGLFGLIAFVGLCGRIFWLGWARSVTEMAQATALALVVIFVHGMIDIPYFKNDLALLFWLFIAFAITGLGYQNPTRQPGSVLK